MTSTMIPIAKLYASEAQTLRLLSLVRDMSRMLSRSRVEGAAALVGRAEAIEAGLENDLYGLSVADRLKVGSFLNEYAEAFGEFFENPEDAPVVITRLLTGVASRGEDDE